MSPEGPSPLAGLVSLSQVQSSTVGWLWPGRIPLGKLTVLDGDPGLGKALEVNTPLPTPEGWTTMGEVRVGAVLFDDRGQRCRVVAATEVMEGRPCYRVVFSDGTEVIADANHQWPTLDHRARRRKWMARWRQKRRGGRTAQRSGPWPRGCTPELRTTAEIAATLREPDGGANHAIEVAASLELPGKELPVDPYTLGIWLGDGEAATNRVSGHDADAEVFELVEAAGYRVSRHPTPSKTTPNWRIHGLGAGLRALGVLRNKHVPAEYLRGNRAQRLALLQGLMDSDGDARVDGLAEFANTNLRLAEAVRELAASLGWQPTLSEGRAMLGGEDMGPKYRVVFYPSEPVFRLRRKAERFKPPRRATFGRRYIVGCEPVESLPVRCIQVDSPSHLYLATRAMIPTDNSTLLLDLAARVSTGAPMPDGSAGPCAGVCILSAEDGLADTIRPRLEAAGADLSRVQALTAVPGAGGSRPPVLPGDLPLLEDMLRQSGSKLLIIDPLMAYLGRGVDAVRDQDVRRCLHRLAEAAEQTECAVVLLRHLTKCGGKKAIYRGGGSIGIIASARSGLLVARDPDSPGHRVLACTKANLAVLPASLRFTLEPTSQGVCRIAWCGVSSRQADDLLAPGDGPEERSALEEACAVLTTLLREGPKPAEQCKLEALAAGVPEITLRRAKLRLGVESVRSGFVRGEWHWRLPPEGSVGGATGEGDRTPGNTSR